MTPGPAALPICAHNFPNGWFVGAEGGGIGSSMNGINQIGAFGNFRSLNYQGVQFGYNFQNAPLTVYAGFDTLKYTAGNGGPFAAFDATSGTLPGYSAHVGAEFRPAPNSACHFPRNSIRSAIPTICPVRVNADQ